MGWIRGLMGTFFGGLSTLKEWRIVGVLKGGMCESVREVLVYFDH